MEIKLDVDSIGSQDKPLTKKESQEISAFIRQWKESKRKDKSKSKRKSNKENVE
ncbi:MAG: hypothetical protein GVY05_05850 [Bacteroidetes bacterium]|jgi:hypothetical protein|nr:hypothetical protein [Bacteroidota bacterium]